MEKKIILQTEAIMSASADYIFWNCLYRKNKSLLQIVKNKKKKSSR